MRLRPRSPRISRSISSTRICYVSRQDRFNFNDSIFGEESIPNYSQFKRVTAGDLAKSQDYPKSVTMLVRDFIQDSLYNPNYGYFSKQAIIFSSKEPLDFPSIRNARELENHIIQTYGSYGATVRGPGRQVWHTPTELFKPWYGRAIAQFILSEYMLRSYPYDDLVIYEIGAGNGTLADDILNFIQQEYPADVYERIRYNIIEISPQLAKIQGKQLRSHPNVKVFNKSVFDWDMRDNSACFFIALEVIDNFPHDEIRYSTETREPYQGIVAINEWGDFYRLYERVSDPLISTYLNLRTTVGRASPAIPPASPLLRRLRTFLPFAANLSKSEFIPTRLLELLYLLRDKFPRHRLLLSDFSSLPDTIPGYYAPVVQTRIRDVMVPCQTFLVKQGFFDIFFPTAFNLLRDMYEHIMSQPHNAPLEGSRASPLLTMAAPSDLGANFFFSHNRRPLTDTITSTSGLPVGGHRSSVFSHKEFMQTYAAVEQTRLKNGENPLLEYYRNVKFFF
ncbi:hypothetical protein Clacol_005744 [Clathrus columnatus]|uniref:Protein arginine methyltransferase NDUFAF7 n=1 Tax=Clathrus columnatus TaxID=1419009 RepID=A0AAV5AG94_9AGAM|nr:hypothetical protein Clacol_005744 [Clathrus columnatus]